MANQQFNKSSFCSAPRSIFRLKILQMFQAAAEMTSNERLEDSWNHQKVIKL